uniref:Tautomerase cis-CaaD-like domain-containing protein n=1 Tax=Streptomyces sp. NBC_01401 TaxID=2903854 RepID=A0AAU3GNL9_9ACTN
MSVSLYYSASRAMPPTDAEAAAVERIVAAHMACFPYEDEESLCLYDGDAGSPGEIVAGSTKLPFDPGRVLSVLDQVLGSVTELRRALPGAEWRVHMDDLDVPWDEVDGYAFPGMRDPDLAAELGSL